MPNPGLIIFELVVMVAAICIHGAAQAWAANRLGDPTARMVGRLSLNPAQHYDPWGTIAWPLIVLLFFHGTLPYGWGKPVPMTYRNFPRKNGEMLSILAGPVAQFLAAVVALIVLLVIKHASPTANAFLEPAVVLANHGIIQVDGDTPGILPVLLLLYFAVIINLLLCVFNMLPVPFLDGGKILMHFLPYNAARAFERNSMYFMLGFFLLGGILVNLFFVPLQAVFTAALLHL